MNERNDQNQIEETDDTPVAELVAVPLNDVDFFYRLRDLVRTEYLWQWDSDNDDAKAIISAIKRGLKASGAFRLLDDIEIEDHCFEFRLWLEASDAFTIGDVDVILIEALALDLGRGTTIVREMSRTGLVYHVLTFGEGRARQMVINVIGPQMQQIRDLGTLTTSALDTFSA